MFAPEKRQRKRVGVATHISKSTGNLIAKAEEELNIGDYLFDQRGKRIGTVFDFFGPVEAPYVAVKPYSEGAEKLINEPLFVEERSRRDFRDKRRGRK